MIDAISADPNLLWKHPVDVPFVRPRKPRLHGSSYTSRQDLNRYVAAFSPETGKFSYIIPHPRFLAWLKKQPPDVQKEEKELWCYDAWKYRLEHNGLGWWKDRDPRFTYKSLDAMVSNYFGPFARHRNPRRGNRKLLSWDPVFYTHYASSQSQHIHSSDHSLTHRARNEQDEHAMYLRFLRRKAQDEGGLWNWVKLGAGYWYHLYLDTKYGFA